MHYGSPEFVPEGLKNEMHLGDHVRLGDGPVTFDIQYQDLVNDQGLSLEVLGNVDGSEVSLLTYYCFDQDPHYFYGPQERGDRKNIDRITEGDPVEWTLRQLRRRLPDLVERAGQPELARSMNVEALAQTVGELEETVRRIAREDRVTVKHNRGDVVFEAGPVRIGVEDRIPGIAVHVLGDVQGEEMELLAFDCFTVDPHYHYGPRNKNERRYVDIAATPDPLRWAMDLLKGGKLASMLERAGYHDHAARLNPATVAEVLPEVESLAFKLRAARSDYSE